MPRTAPRPPKAEPFWHDLIASWKTSGQSVAAFCADGAGAGSFSRHFPLAIHRTAMYDADMKLNKDLVAAYAAPLVLSLLKDGESYGYAIIQRVRELSGGAVEWTDGMLYPVLHRLEAQGHIKSRWGTSV